MFKKLISGILLSLGFVCFLNSQVPQLINYQGILTDNAGEPLTGTRSIQFIIYDAATAGNLLWSETQSVDVEDGLFNVLLGSVIPMAYELFEEANRYLAIKVEADNEMTPRQQLTSVGFAFQSRSTQLLNFQAPSENDGTVNEGDDPVSWYKLKDMPADFADGTDDVGSGGSGITQINGGTGLTITNPTGPTTTLALDMGHANGINADMVDGNHATDFATSAHDHLGEIWDVTNNTTNGFRIRGNIPWSNSVLVVQNSNSGPSILGYNDATGNGIRGQNMATGIGVYGEGAAGNGVQGYSTDAFGGFFMSNNDHYDLALGGSVGRVNTDISDENSQLYLSSNADVIVKIDNDGGEDHAFRIKNSGGTDVFIVDENGESWATGAKNAKVNTESFGERLVYCVESPEVWFEDFGNATLLEGEVEVEFEAIFAATVNLDFDYHVFLTPLGQEPVLLFITEKTSTGFKVKGAGLDGNPVKCDFDYRIIAKRLGFENRRLEEPKF